MNSPSNWLTVKLTRNKWHKLTGKRHHGGDGTTDAARLHHGATYRQTHQELKTAQVRSGWNVQNPGASQVLTLGPGSRAHLHCSASQTESNRMGLAQTKPQIQSTRCCFPCCFYPVGVPRRPQRAILSPPMPEIPERPGKGLEQKLDREGNAEVNTSCLQTHQCGSFFTVNAPHPQAPKRPHLPLFVWLPRASTHTQGQLGMRLKSQITAIRKHR